MPVYKPPALTALAAAVAALFAGLQTWVELSRDGSTFSLSGQGKLTSSDPWANAQLAARHGFPMAWVVGVIAALIAVSAVAHLLGSLRASAAGKGIMLGSVLLAVAVVAAFFNERALTGFEARDLQDVAVSSGYAPWLVIAAAIVAFLAGGALFLEGAGDDEATA